MRDSTRSRSARVRRGLSRFWRKAYSDGLTGLAGMVAYNLLLSLLPLTLLALFLFGTLAQSESAQQSVIADVQRILPNVSEATIDRLLKNIESSSTSLGIAALISSVWIGASFWGALDTAFCRIYHSECRSWLQQKRFALVMLVVVLVLFAATVGLPAAQGVVARGAGSDAVRWFTLALTAAVLFATLALIYRVVPNCRVPWTAIWPGALGATVAIAAIDWAFPLYLRGSVFSTFGGTYVFVLIVLVWFYVVAIILLGGAVINALRLEALDGPP